MNVDYDGFLTEVRRLVASRDSAIVRILREPGQPLIALGVLKGEIVSASCGSVRGSAALDEIREMESGTLHVQHVKFHKADEDLPATEEILSLLGGSGNH